MCVGALLLFPTGRTRPRPSTLLPIEASHELFILMSELRERFCKEKIILNTIISILNIILNIVINWRRVMLDLGSAAERRTEGYTFWCYHHVG